VPASEKYIFQGSNPGSIDDERPRGKGVKKSKLQFTHKMLAQKPKITSGGEV
jgi:oxalate decarboxylase/phosphoglucose isomerase-like protein (cupin superfamily)